MLAYDGAMSDMLALSASLPEVAFAPGEIVIREGGSAGGLWILVSGALKVTKCGVVVNSVTRPARWSARSPSCSTPSTARPSRQPGRASCAMPSTARR
jgi:hypothetical protein